MRLSLRFLIPLALALGAIAYGVVPLVDDLTLKWFVRDLDIRKNLIASAVQEPLAELLTTSRATACAMQRVQTLLTRILQDERLYALGFCDAAGQARVPQSDAARGGRLHGARRAAAGSRPGAARCARRAARGGSPGARRRQARSASC